MSKNSICIKCKNQYTCGLCDLSCGTSHISTCICYTERKQTNADRIRSMSDEELAKKISGLESFALICGGGWPPEKWLDWLKEEVKEE